jgi:hypothetical protein
MPRRRPSTFLEGALGVALALVVGVVAPRAARAQVCCVGTGLVTPARLRAFESYAVGLQLRARSVTGAFGPGGDYASMSPGSSDRSFEQDLLAAARFGARLQAAVTIPFVETSRRAGDLAGAGGGLGDLSLSTRWDFVRVGERGAWPGLAALVGLSVPTGRPPKAASDPLAATATGQGSYEASLGLAAEQVFGRSFVSVTAWVSQRTERSVSGVRQSLAPRFTVLAAGGYSFARDVTLGGFALGMHEGDGHDPRGPIAGSGLSLMTAGLAVALPLGDSTRLQLTSSADVPLGGWGRNQTVGLGAAGTVLVYWL